jgi:hypothetical protein
VHLEDDVDLKCSLSLISFSVLPFIEINVQKILAITLKTAPFAVLDLGLRSMKIWYHNK